MYAGGTDEDSDVVGMVGVAGEGHRWIEEGTQGARRVFQGVFQGVFQVVLVWGRGIAERGKYGITRKQDRDRARCRIGGYDIVDILPTG